MRWTKGGRVGETDFADGEIHLDKEGRKTKRREGAGVGRDRERNGDAALLCLMLEEAGLEGG